MTYFEFGDDDFNLPPKKIPDAAGAVINGIVGLDDAGGLTKRLPNNHVAKLQFLLVGSCDVALTQVPGNQALSLALEMVFPVGPTIGESNCDSLVPNTKMAPLPAPWAEKIIPGTTTSSFLIPGKSSILHWLTEDAAPMMLWLAESAWKGNAIGTGYQQDAFLGSAAVFEIQQYNKVYNNNQGWYTPPDGSNWGPFAVARFAGAAKGLAAKFSGTLGSSDAVRIRSPITQIAWPELYGEPYLLASGAQLEVVNGDGPVLAVSPSGKLAVKPVARCWRWRIGADSRLTVGDSVYTAMPRLYKETVVSIDIYRQL